MVMINGTQALTGLSKGDWVVCNKEDKDVKYLCNFTSGTRKYYLYLKDKQEEIRDANPEMPERRKTRV